jgi:hypothetical protein
MNPSHPSIPALAALGSLLLPSAVLAQGYPKVDPAIQKAADEAKSAGKNRSKDLFKSQQAALREWAAKGKPYLPGAGKPSDLPQAKIPSFPGAWGGGMYSFGGRGGKVFVVTSLEDNGPGTFREACEAVGPRIVVFNVAGIIKLKGGITIRTPYITIAGNTAPGDGVCIAGGTVELEAHDILIRHMRFRRGETDVTDRNDSIGGNPVGNVMIDHVSASWGLDENMSMYRHMYDPPDGSKAQKLPTVNITIQNSIFSEGLNTFHHAFGATIGGHNSTFHHNLWACNTGRNPSVGMDGDFTFANNVIFNWVHRTIDGGDHKSFYSIINNYFKPGPATPNEDIRFRLLKPESERSKTVVDNFGKAYVHGNIVEGVDRVTKDNWDGGVQPDSRASVDEVLPKIRTDKPFDHAPLDIQKDAKAAYETVLTGSGATLPKRDPIDTRIVETVRTGKTTSKAGPDTRKQLNQPPYTEKDIDKQLELIGKGIITNPDQVGGYPEYKGTPYQDSDKDGLPDDWESKHALNPKDAADAIADANGDGYSNIEDFINGLDPRAPKTDWANLKNNIDPRNVR